MFSVSVLAVRVLAWIATAAMGMAVICRLDQSQATKLLDDKALQIYVTLEKTRD